MKMKWKLTVTLLGLCLVSLLVAGCGEETEAQVFTNRTPSKQQESTDEEPEEVPEYRLEELNMEEETLTLRSLSTGRQVRYSYNLGTVFLDKYGQSCSSGKFTPGQIVQLGTLTESSVLSSVQMSDTVWNYEDVTKYTIDADQGMLIIGNTKYRITEDTAVFSDSNQIALTDVGTDDTLYVIGKDKNILSIMVITGHGYLQLANTDLFQDSLICIGNRIFTIITGDMTIEVPEGSYDITVANNGYGGTANYTVTRNETTVVDLDQLKGSGPKTCQVTFETEVEGANVYIDGTKVAIGEALTVTYGSHKLTVMATGYDTWQKTLVVNSPSATIVLDLTDEESTSSTTTTDTTDSSTGGSSSDSSSTTDSSSTSSDTDAEVDYLTTLSNMLSNLLD